MVTYANGVPCVFCEGAHLFEECSVNLVFVSYVGNNKYNNPYSKTYNLGWHNHPNFSWSNIQNYLKPQAPQFPQGFSISNHVVATQGDNQIKNILKSFIKETKNQFQAQV